MLPKKIHYCWFGGNELPDLAIKCIESWKKYCPDYEIIEWNETNFDLECCDFVKEAYKAKKWAFVSDYARLKVVYDNGGIYLDTDVELVKSLDILLQEKCYFGEETTGYVATGLGFGAENGNRTSDFFPLCINSLRDFSDLEVTDAPELICASIPLHTTIQR